jgi:hypothetical protein
MRCSKKLIEDRGICADCEILFLDDAVRLKQALEVALRDERVMRENLTAVQARCTELLEENRLIRSNAIEACARICSQWADANREAFLEQALAGDSCAHAIREQRWGRVDDGA